MATSTVIIDPATGERVEQAAQSVKIDPATGERMDAAPPQQAHTIGAAPPRGVVGYLQDVERDLTQGGTRTIVGRGLGHMQGAGDKGYSGMNSGVSPDQAQFMGSVPLGLSKVATGIAQTPSHPVQGPLHAVAGALQAATIPTAFVAPEATEAVGEAANAAKTAIAGKISPAAMKEAAGGMLQSVAHDANKIPVQLENAGDAALRLMDWQKKTQLGPTVNKFLNRITNPKLGAMTYEEARDFYQLLGKLSADETMKMAPPVKRDLVQMVVGLKQDIGNAADQVGKAADYYQGLSDYARASKLQGWYDAAKDVLSKEAVSGVIKGLGLGAGGALGYQIYKKAQ
jgi:hypothetical protein